MKKTKEIKLIKKTQSIDSRIDEFIKKEGLEREHMFFRVDKNGKLIENYAHIGDDVLIHQEDWFGEDWLSVYDVVTESLLRKNGINPNNACSVVAWDLRNKEKIINGTQLDDKEWIKFIKIFAKENHALDL